MRKGEMAPRRNLLLHQINCETEFVIEPSKMASSSKPKPSQLSKSPRKLF